MNLTRLMALGTLARFGAMHGHQIRRVAEVTNVDERGGISVGALYRELRTMEAEGLVEALRTEQVGRRPARTVYSITGEGDLELAMLRERAVRGLHWGADPLAVALTFAIAGIERDELVAALTARREMCAMTCAGLAERRRQLVAKGYANPVVAAVIRRSEMHAETEMRWHDELAKILADLPATLDLEPLIERIETAPRDGAPGGGVAPAPAYGPVADRSAPAARSS